VLLAGRESELRALNEAGSLIETVKLDGDYAAISEAELETFIADRSAGSGGGPGTALAVPGRGPPGPSKSRSLLLIVSEVRRHAVTAAKRKRSNRNRVPPAAIAFEGFDGRAFVANPGLDGQLVSVAHHRHRSVRDAFDSHELAILHFGLSSITIHRSEGQKDQVLSLSGREISYRYKVISRKSSNRPDAGARSQSANAERGACV
jgi:hypothetical protein